MSLDLVLDAGNGDMMSGTGFSGMGGWWMLIWMGLFWLPQILIAFWILSDGRKQGIDAAPWAIVTLIPWIGYIAILMYLVIRTTDARRAVGEPTHGAVAILEERYARGELDRDTYLQARGDLQERS